VIPKLSYERGANQSAVYYNNYFMIQNASNTTDMGGIFMTAARLNHSCVPNCYTVWNPSIERLCIRAIRQVQAGEELFICYDKDELFLAKRAYRIEKLKERYGFECECPGCDLSTPISRQGSLLRDGVAGLVERARSLSEKHKQASIEVYSDLLRLMRDLGLETWEKGKL
jgi:hypothetical protein